MFISISYDQIRYTRYQISRTTTDGNMRMFRRLFENVNGAYITVLIFLLKVVYPYV